MSQRLSTLDTAFLHAEHTDPHTRLGIGGLAILDGPMPEHDALMATLSERIAACPRFSQRLRRRVFDLDAPQWVDDDKFDLAYHVRRVALPGSGTDEDLYSVVADVMSWQLDHDRPLWEIWLISELAGGRWAMLMKVHPCLADAVATVHILTGLSDDAVAGGDAVEHCMNRHPAGSARIDAAHPAPSPWLAALRAPAQIAGDALAAAREIVRSANEFAAGLQRPPSPLNGPVTSRRRYTAAHVALDDVHQICRTFNVTVDDVALAALTEVYRDMLLRRGEKPNAESLRTLVPSRGAIRLPYLPVHEANPVLRLRLIHARMEQMTGSGVEGLVAAATRMLPFPVTAWALDLLARLPQRNVATMAVNVAGPRRPLQVMGRNVIGVLPIPPIAVQLRSAAAVLNYADQLFFGILADFDAVPDAEELARGVEAAVARLLERSRRRRGQDRHGMSLVVTA
ncbi:wax ester/triacylglycerol synthase family O-acyltransferase [[Mycobacterium] zoologicum]|uniref:wax ester/triacylglycerol synthase family O-acyltransferase n=1 Tax=[Mycobacterium] zoologicum TaxID=2872311 RepID=UPI001CDA7385|nr:wax ester/triacylglycerol synthase family O-acyltransferase [Mycolicibacter sp. MYC101]MEB3062610.1 wax ester/triacylglycerol synthase family O-acyltransferase [Mycolicibacter sp. MYC101]